MENSELINILSVLLTFLIILLFILFTIYIVLVLKKRKKENEAGKKKVENKTNSKGKEGSLSTEDLRKSVMDFMNFYSIQDDMIVQKKAKRYIMVLKCQGINYDLMSELEKNSVEAGFVQFLNTLNFPIQLYIQTRKVNLTSSLNTYKNKFKQIEEKLNKVKYQYDSLKKSENADEKQLNRLLYEVTKQTNLYRYTEDIIRNTEMMSLNKNILNKQYYIVISYTPEGDESALMGEDEIAELAFSELYTRAQSLSRVLMVCDVSSKILNSMELAELLYVAYNRDESDIFGIDKAFAAGYDSLYVTAPDVLDKKKKNLDRVIEEKAWNKANEAVTKARIKSKKEREVEEKEQNLDDLIKEMAQMIVEQNASNLTSEIADKAIEEINSSEDTGEDE